MIETVAVKGSLTDEKWSTRIPSGGGDSDGVPQRKRRPTEEMLGQKTDQEALRAPETRPVVAKTKENLGSRLSACSAVHRVVV